MPGFLVGGPNPGQQDAKGCVPRYASSAQARSYLDASRPLCDEHMERAKPDIRAGSLPWDGRRRRRSISWPYADAGDRGPASARPTAVRYFAPPTIAEITLGYTCTAAPRLKRPVE